MDKQPELDLAPVAKVKARQLAALRAPHSVVVDFDTGRMEEYKGTQMMLVRADVQWAVPNVQWLERLKRAMNNYQQMLDQHARERGVVQSVISTILEESRQLTDADIPKVQVQANRNGPLNVNMDDGLPWEGIPEDDDEPPF